MMLDGFRFSRHALQRALDMQLEPEQIRQCLQRPEYITQCRQRPEFDLYFNGDITVSVARANGTVATILWRGEDKWTQDLKDRPEYQGRSYRGDDNQ